MLLDNNLTSIDVSDLISLLNLILNNNNLTSINISGLSYLESVYINFNSLTQTAVDNILVTLANGSIDGGEVELVGGSNSAPSAIGLAAKTTLEGRGWTVIVTP